MLLSAAILASCASAPSYAMDYNVCKKAADYAVDIQQKIHTGKTTASAENAAIQNEGLYPDTLKLLTYMHKLADRMKDEDAYDFELRAFGDCLRFEPSLN